MQGKRHFLDKSDNLRCPECRFQRPLMSIHPHLPYWRLCTGPGSPLEHWGCYHWTASWKSRVHLFHNSSVINQDNSASAVYYITYWVTCMTFLLWPESLWWNGTLLKTFHYRWKYIIFKINQCFNLKAIFLKIKMLAVKRIYKFW